MKLFDTISKKLADNYFVEISVELRFIRLEQKFSVQWIYRIFEYFYLYFKQFGSTAIDKIKYISEALH
jgi:hypothetical protein